ncbi:hypothetical protein Pelo_11661 [Pelomyxa schiedti]|nr:hypothetical protein Pelo_11661 [Pelomyxa schiedti]
MENKRKSLQMKKTVQWGQSRVYPPEYFTIKLPLKCHSLLDGSPFYSQLRKYLLVLCCSSGKTESDCLQHPGVATSTERGGGSGREQLCMSCGTTVPDNQLPLHHVTVDMDEEMDSISSALMDHMMPASDAVFWDCQRTLLMVIKNILANPTNERVRRLPLSNSKFRESVGSAPGGKQMLSAMGFEEAGNALILPPASSLSRLTKAKDLLEHAEAIRKKYKAREAASQRNSTSDSERERILRQLHADRQEAAQKEFRDLHAQQLPSSGTAKVTRFKDIGVDLCKRGG